MVLRLGLMAVFTLVVGVSVVPEAPSEELPRRAFFGDVSIRPSTLGGANAIFVEIDGGETQEGRPDGVVDGTLFFQTESEVPLEASGSLTGARVEIWEGLATVVGKRDVSGEVFRLSFSLTDRKTKNQDGFLGLSGFGLGIKRGVYESGSPCIEGEESCYPDICEGEDCCDEGGEGAISCDIKWGGDEGCEVDCLITSFACCNIQQGLCKCCADVSGR